MVLIDPSNKVYPYAIIGDCAQSRRIRDGEWGDIKIGKNNTFRNFMTVHKAEFEGNSTIIGDNNLFFEHSHVGHDAHVGNNCIIGHCAAIAGYVDIGNNVRLQHLVGVVPRARVGSYVFTEDKATITHDTPPYMVVIGRGIVKTINRIGLEWAGFTKQQIKNIYKAHKILYKSKLVRVRAIKELKKFNTPEINEIVKFLEGKRRCP